MIEFFGRLIKSNKVDRKTAYHLSRLAWITLKGSYVFAKPDPALRGEQNRYVGICCK